MIRGVLIPMDRFDILYTEGFYLNFKKYITYRSGIQKEHLAVYLISLYKFFYELQCAKELASETRYKNELTDSALAPEKKFYQCTQCLNVYDEENGEPENDILPGIAFSTLPESYCCPLCDGAKADFSPVLKTQLNQCMPN